MGPLRILLADDHDFIRRGLRELLERQPGWKIVAEAKDGREAVAKAKQVKPDVALLDIAMPLLNGLDVARQMLQDRPYCKILMLTIHESSNLVRHVLEAGARGYLLKSDAERDLVAAVEGVCSGRTFFTAKVSEMLLESYLGKQAGAPETAEDARLTPRHREIIQLLAEGKSSKEVAAILDMTVKTAETHRAHIMERLGFHNVSELVRYAIRNQIIEA